MASQPTNAATPDDTTAEPITARALLAVIDRHRRWAIPTLDGQPALLFFDGDILVVHASGDVDHRTPAHNASRPGGTWPEVFGWPWQPVQAHQVAAVHGLYDADQRPGHIPTTMQDTGA